MTKKKSIWAFVLALCLIVPAMFMMTACGNKNKGGETAHTHTYSTEWTTDATHHWHAATCEHTDEKDSYGEHTVTTWTTKTEAGLHVDKVEQGTCTICEKVVERTVSNTATHTYSTTWSKNETQHWKESTCEGHTPALKSEVADHTFGAWEEKTPANYGVNKVEKHTCIVCGFEDEREVENSALAPKTNIISVEEEELLGMIYNAKPQPINDSVSASYTAGMVIKYKGTGDTTYAESTTAPTNAGDYEYTISIPATAEWKEAQKTGSFTIKKYTVTCPSVLVARLASGQTETNVLHEIDLSDNEDGYDAIGEIILIHTEKTFKVGRTANLNKSKIACSNPNIAVNTGSKAIDLVVLDTGDEFRFRITDTVTIGSCYTGNIDHGYVEVNDKMKIVGTNASGEISMFDVTITKIEYLTNKYATEKTYKETTVATKDEIVKITFTKNTSDIMKSYDNIVSTRDMNAINQFQTSKSANADFAVNEYRAFKVAIETTDSIILTVSNQDSCTVKAFNATTGEEITLESNSFSVTSGTEVIIVVKQNSTSATHEIKLATITLTM